MSVRFLLNLKSMAKMSPKTPVEQQVVEVVGAEVQILNLEEAGEGQVFQAQAVGQVLLQVFQMGEELHFQCLLLQVPVSLNSFHEQKSLLKAYLHRILILSVKLSKQKKVLRKVPNTWRSNRSCNSLRLCNWFSSPCCPGLALKTLGFKF